MKKDLLPLPTTDAEIRHYALRAIARTDDENEKVALENTPEHIPSLMDWYIESYIRDFQCLSLLKQKYGMGEVEKLRAEFEALSFLAKMRLGGCGESGVQIIPGQPTRTPLNLLLFEGSPPLSSLLGGGSCEEWWVRGLHAVGLGGSVLIVSGNFSSCWKVASTGKVHALLMQDDDGYSSKVRHFRAYQEELRKLGLPVPPLFAHGGYTYSPDPLVVGLKKFFAKHFA